MDVDNVYGGSPDNFDDMRGLTKYLANNSSSDIIFITNGLVNYTKHMKRNNNFMDKFVEPVDSSQLLYTTNNNQKIQSSRMAKLSTNIGLQHVNNKELSHSNHKNNNMFNI